MSVIVPFNRRGYVVRPSVSLLPLPARAAADPSVTLAAREAGVEIGDVCWNGGITLVASLAAGEGLSVAVRARADAADKVEQLFLLAPGAGGSRAGQAEVALRVRVPRSQMVAAVARHTDGRLTGALAELRMSS